MGDAGGNVALPIHYKGPLIDVRVKLPGSPHAGIQVRGLIDTGADFVLLSPSIAKRLELRHVNNDVVGGIGGGQFQAQVYSGAISVPELEFERTLPLYAVPWDPTSHTVLLGRSFLKHFIFRYDGPSDVFHFSRPVD